MPPKPSPRASATTLSLYRTARTASSALVTSLLNHAALRFEADFAALGHLDPNRGTFARFEVSDDCPLSDRPLALVAGFAALRREVLALDDTAADARLARDPLLGPGGSVRALAAAPVLDADGERTAVLVVAASRPTRWPATAQRELESLAATLTQVLTLERAVAGLHDRHGEHLQRIEKLEGLERATARLAILTTDLQGVIRSMNAGAERMLRRPASSLVGKTTPDVLTTVQGATAQTIAELESRESVERKCEWVRGDGVVVPVHTVVSAATDEVGTQTGYVILGRDISHDQRLERMQEAFVATVSHELRTPLTSVLGALKLVVGGVAGELPPRARKLLDMAVSNGEQLALLVDDILDTAALAAGPSLELGPCDLDEIAEAAVEANQPLAMSLDVELVAQRDGGDTGLQGDRDRLVQVLNNLISNAAKFSPPRARVEVRTRGDADTVSVVVTDQGPGVPVEDRIRVFDRFTQLETKPRGRSRGTGLGLSIVRAIVEAHGGRVWVDEAPGGGAAFHAEFPRTAELP